MSILSLTRVQGTPTGYQPGGVLFHQWLPGCDTEGPLAVTGDPEQGYWPLQSDFDEEARSFPSYVPFGCDDRYTHTRVRLESQTKYVLPCISYRIYGSGQYYGPMMYVSVKLRLVSSGWAGALAELNLEDDLWLGHVPTFFSNRMPVFFCHKTPAGGTPYIYAYRTGAMFNWLMFCQPNWPDPLPCCTADLRNHAQTDAPDGIWTIVSATDANGDPVDPGDYGTVETYGADPAWWVNHS